MHLHGVVPSYEEGQIYLYYLTTLSELYRPSLYIVRDDCEFVVFSCLAHPILDLIKQTTLISFLLQLCEELSTASCINYRT
jgi:hypothetical protein